MCLLTHPKGGSVSIEGFRRRDADGCGRDGRAPEEVANDWDDIFVIALVAAPSRYALRRCERLH